MADKIDITGIDKAELLAGLYNRSKPQGLGFIHFDKNPMTRDQAQKILDATPSKYFDYLQGRVMKVDLSSDTELGPWGFDRDNGQGAAQSAVDAIRTKSALPTRDASDDAEKAAKLVINAEMSGEPEIASALAANLKRGFLQERLDKGAKDPKVKPEESSNFPPR